MTIILYDIPSTTPENAWSTNIWKTRFALNFKGIPHKTEWVEYPDIEAHAKEHGILPTEKKPDGRDHYTLPAIYDPSTGLYVSDSLTIAEYLEKTYPDTPSLFPHNTLGLQTAFTDAFQSNLNSLWAFIVPITYPLLNPASQPYFRATREPFFGATLEALAPTGEAAVEQWAKFQSGLGNVDAWYGKSGKGPYLLGETPSWGDLMVASYLIWMKIVFGKESQQWKDISTWHNGRWGTLLENLKEYSAIF